jgi:hypothetical protein
LVAASVSLRFWTTLPCLVKTQPIENLNSRIATLEGEKADLEKKLAAVPVKQVDEEKLRHHQELIEKIPDFINEGRKILQTFEEKGDTDLIKTQSLDWQKKVLLLLSELGPAYAAPFQTAQGTLYVVGGHTDMEGNSVYSLLRGKIDVLNTFLAEMRRWLPIHIHVQKLPSTFPSGAIAGCSVVHHPASIIDAERPLPLPRTIRHQPR